MKSRSLPRTLSLFAIATSLAFSGCSTPGSSPISASSRAPGTTAASQAKSPATPEPLEGVPLVVGMKSGEVEGLLGAPAEIQPMEIEGLKADVWVYLRTGKPVTREITTGMRDVHYVDPISGRELVRQEPIVGYQTQTPNLELRLLMFNGSLLNWSQIVRSIDQTSV